ILVEMMGDALFGDHHDFILRFLMAFIDRIFFVDFDELVLVVIFLAKNGASSRWHPLPSRSAQANRGGRECRGDSADHHRAAHPTCQTSFRSERGCSWLVTQIGRSEEHTSELQSPDH